MNGMDAIAATYNAAASTEPAARRPSASAPSGPANPTLPTLPSLPAIPSITGKAETAPVPSVPSVSVSGATAQTSGFTDATGPATHSAPTASTTSTGPASSVLPTTSTGTASSAGPTSTGPASSAPAAAEVPYVYPAMPGLTPAPLVFGFGGAGGLASSPNVPKPGTTIDPATGKPHTSGLTRAELEAKKAAAASAAAAAPTRASLDGKGKEKDASELSGRVQAARQLAQTSGALGAASTGTTAEKARADEPITPGLEVPGGWGVATGTHVHSTTTIYDDVGEGLRKVGTAAYAALPASLKGALSSTPASPATSDSPALATPGSPRARRGSAVAILEQAKMQGTKIVHDIQETVQGAGRRASGTDTIVGHVKEFWGEIIGVPAATYEAQVKASASGATGLSAPRTSLPSDEPVGALPGEHSSGVGALPGLVTETGVAVLPDEKKPKGPSDGQNQGMLPGEVPFNAAAISKSSESANASGLKREAPSLGNLAAPLPSTYLGQGAAHGATNIKPTGPNPVEEAPSSSSAGPVSSVSGLPDTKLANNRTSSTASVTAIRSGKEGTKFRSSADGVNVKAATLAASGAPKGTGFSDINDPAPGGDLPGVGHPATRGQEGTSREPGSYPDADHSSTPAAPSGTTETATDPELVRFEERKTEADKIIEPVPSATSTTGAAERTSTPDTSVSDSKANETLGPAGTVSSDAPAASATTSATSTNGVNEKVFPSAPATTSHTPTANGNGKGTNSATATKNGRTSIEQDGHRRTPSNASANSKKAGFMAKLKQKIKHEL